MNVLAYPKAQKPTKHKRVSSQDVGGLVPGMQGDGFASEPGRIMEVAVWLCVLLLLGL